MELRPGEVDALTTYLSYLGVLVKVTKECLGWEEVQLLKMGAVRTLVALA